MLSQLNLNQLRVFQSVYLHKSMTKAAQNLYLTQPGVSQHIKNLEETLNVVLFDRFGKNIVPTSKATYLYRECTMSMDSIDNALVSISGNELKGTVTIGSPPEFAQTIISPILVKLRKKYPGIVVNLQIGLASQMMRYLIDGQQDMGFMDDFAADSRLVSEKIFDEHIELCAIRSLLKKFPMAKKPKSLAKDLPLLAYLPGAPVLRKWHLHHFGAVPSKLNVTSYLSNSQNVARMIVLGQGAGVLTGQHINDLCAQGHKIDRIIIKDNPLINPISLNRLKHRTSSKIEMAVEEFFKKELLKGH